jgi:ElaB/YqjD/DUF883 family membrane-anchored ribosome-binding protein
MKDLEKRGAKFRKELSKRVEGFEVSELVDDTKDRFEKIQDEAKAQFEKVQDQVEEAVDNVRDRLKTDKAA